MKKEDKTKKKYYEGVLDVYYAQKISFKILNIKQKSNKCCENIDKTCATMYTMMYTTSRIKIERRKICSKRDGCYIMKYSFPKNIII